LDWGCFGLSSSSIVCSVLRLRLKDLPLALPLEMAYLRAAYPIGGGDRLRTLHRIIGIIPRSQPFAFLLATARATNGGVHKARARRRAREGGRGRAVGRARGRGPAVHSSAFAAPLQGQLRLLRHLRDLSDRAAGPRGAASQERRRSARAAATSSASTSPGSSSTRACGPRTWST
jgi:hypothetical protein